MRPKSALDRLERLLRAPAFTSRDAARLHVSAATLSYYAKSGTLERLSRGVYRASSAPMVEDLRWEDLVSAIRGVKDGVVCLTSALAFYDLTEEVPRQHWIAIAHSTRHRALPTVRVIRMRNLNLGRTEISMSGIKVPIFDRERTIVDAFRYLGRETAIKALKLATTKRGREKLDLEKTRRYAKALRVKLEPYLIAVAT